MTPFTLLIQKLPDGPNSQPVSLLTFDGELDASNVEETSPRIYKLIEEGNKHMVLIFGFEGLRYMNSRTIGYMTDWNSRIKAKGGYIALVNLPPNIQDLLSSIGILNLFTVFDTLENAKKQIYDK